MCAEQAHLTHARHQLQRKRAFTEVGDDGGQGFRLDEVANGVTHLTLVIGELRFDIQQVYATVGLHEGLAIRVMEESF